MQFDKQLHFVILLPSQQIQIPKKMLLMVNEKKKKMK